MSYIENLFKINHFFKEAIYSGERTGNMLHKLTEFTRKDSAKLLKDILQWIIKNKDISLSSIGRTSGKRNKSGKVKDIVSNYSKILTNTKLIMNFMWKYIHKVTKILWKWWNTVYVAVDWWDIKKKHSKSDNTCKVRDGSTGDIVKWYALETLIWFNENLEVVPLIWKLFTRRKWYKSDNNEYFNLLEKIEKHISKTLDICYIFDRWYDNWKLFEYISSIKRKFIVAMRNNRYVKVKGKTVYIWNAKERLKSTKWEVEVELKGGEKITWKMYYGMVKLPKNKKRKYYLVVIKNNNKHVMFLTNKEVKNKEQAKKIIKIYSYRWLVEETYKYMKQEYKLEYINIRGWMDRMNNYYNLLLSWIWMWMIGLSNIWSELKELIVKERSKEYADYKVKNLMYAWLEVIEYIFRELKLYQNRYRRKLHLYQQNSLFNLN